MKFVENVIPFLRERLEAGERIAIATLVNIDGSSPRPVGAQIGVSEDGKSAGMITGGCAESAIVAEAQRCIKIHENKIVRYGEGSPYLDVVLPCGSGIDIHIETKNAEEIVRAVAEYDDTRRTGYVEIDLDQLTSAFRDEAPQRDQNTFVKTHDPDYRIFVFGEGVNLASFCANASAAGFDTRAFSPDEAALAYLGEQGVTCEQIHRTADFNALRFDEFSAVVTLFHEHDWETAILRAALTSNADYIGALGSRTTHAARLEALMTPLQTKRPATIIRGPIGMDIGAQNPNEIAVAILAEIIAHRRGRRS
ncbi:MAG: XdhC family protein [Marinicaulis sp.]|nr:XdhC family protein [Marinicaulis sp.]NNL88350.1 XdhC family protein [Marinicaulis sp.]